MQYIQQLSSIEITLNYFNYMYFVMWMGHFSVISNVNVAGNDGCLPLGASYVFISDCIWGLICSRIVSRT